MIKGKVYVLRKNNKYFTGTSENRTNFWTLSLHNAMWYTTAEKAKNAIPKMGCLENSEVVECDVRYYDNYNKIRLAQ